MYTDEKETPSQSDMELAQVLIDEGYHSTSHKYKTISKWKIPRPTAKQLILPEYLGTKWAKELINWWDQRPSLGLRSSDEQYITAKVLTDMQFKAFKKLCGPSA